MTAWVVKLMVPGLVFVVQLVTTLKHSSASSTARSLCIEFIPFSYLQVVADKVQDGGSKTAAIKTRLR
jgi:hypothetical protein